MSFKTPEMEFINRTFIQGSLHLRSLSIVHHRQARLNRAGQHSKSIANYWRYIDEFRFVSAHGRVWRQARERFTGCAVVTDGRCGGSSLMVLATIWSGTDIQMKTVNAQMYLDEVMRSLVNA